MSPKPLDLRKVNPGKKATPPRKSKTPTKMIVPAKKPPLATSKENFWRNLRENRALQVGLIVLCFLLAAGVSYGAYAFVQSINAQEPPPSPVIADPIPQEASLEAESVSTDGRRLDGVKVDPEDINHQPVAVMIENLSTVRPQHGLNGAGVVYEALAEGGITRFMAVFSGTMGMGQEIHPVRSARPYYLEWSSEYRALYCHAGGSPQALEIIDGFKIPHLNGIGAESRYMWRGPGSAPHNLYTSAELLARALRDYKLDKTVPDYDPWKFKDELEESARPDKAQLIRLDFSSIGYLVEYQYDRSTNEYMRYNGGSKHLDAVDKKQIHPKNIVVQITDPVWPAGDEGRIGMDVTGEGKAVVFRDGEVIEGTWRKDDREGRTKFFNDEDQEIQLNRGQTWVEVLPSDRPFTYN